MTIYFRNTETVVLIDTEGDVIVYRRMCKFNQSNKTDFTSVDL